MPTRVTAVTVFTIKWLRWVTAACARAPYISWAELKLVLPSIFPWFLFPPIFSLCGVSFTATEICIFCRQFPCLKVVLYQYYTEVARWWRGEKNNAFLTQNKPISHKCWNSICLLYTQKSRFVSCVWQCILIQGFQAVSLLGCAVFCLW